MRYLLDTNIASAALRGERRLDERLQQLQPGDWCISAVTRAEMRFGLARKPDATRLARIVESFLQTTTTAAWDTAAADAYGALRAELERRGTPIGSFDEMIAAHALSLGAIVVTDNLRHFRRVPGLQVENWLRRS